MNKTFFLIVVMAVSLAACGVVRDSRINPFNWFGRSTSEPIAQEAPENTNPLIPRRGGLFARAREEQPYLGQPFEQIIDLKVERIPGGAVIRATGLAARQGIYAVQLNPANEEEEPVDGVLTYRLEGVRPGFNTPTGTKPTREVTAARRVTDDQLEGVRSIRVEGQLNARVARR